MAVTILFMLSVKSDVQEVFMFYIKRYHQYLLSHFSSFMILYKAQNINTILNELSLCLDTSVCAIVIERFV